MVRVTGGLTKGELLGALHNVLNNFIFGMVVSRIVPKDAWSSVASQSAIFQGPQGELLTVKLEPIFKNMASPSDRKILIEEFENGLKRSLMSEGHEVILWYCEETGQFHAYENMPWFQFARIIRNVVSHKQGGILKNWPMDLTQKGITKCHGETACWTPAWSAKKLTSRIKRHCSYSQINSILQSIVWRESATKAGLEFSSCSSKR